MYTLEGADYPYRALVENIREGALTLTPEGTILYANVAFAAMRNLPLPSVLGGALADHVAPRDRERFAALLADARSGACRGELGICSGAGTLYVLVSMNPVVVSGDVLISVLVTDRRQDYGRFRLLAQMLDSVVDAVSAAGPDGRIVYWNDAAERLYGWSAAEMLGRSITEISGIGMTTGENGDMVEALAAGRPWSGEFVVRHRDGRTFPVLATRAPVYDDDGRLVAVIGTSHDISERQEAEETLRESEARFRSVIESSRDVVYRVNLGTGRYEYISPSCQAVVGYTPEELMALGQEESLTMVHPDDLPVLRAALAQVEATGTGRAVYRQRAKNGDYSWLSNRMSIIRDDVGRPLHRTGAIRDITDEKNAAEALSESERRLRDVLEVSLDAAYRRDLVADRYDYLSPVIQEITGYSTGEFAGLPLDEVMAMIRPDDRTAVLAATEEGATLGRGTLEYRLRHRDGIYRWVSDYFVVQHDDAGRPVRRGGVVRDVTARREGEESLRRYARNLARSNEELQRFAYVASHDLQEPLRSIVSFSQLLERRYKGKLGTDADEYIDFIVDGGVRMQSLIRDLQFSRIETLAGEPVPADAGRAVADALVSFNGQVRELGGTVTVGPLPTVCADPRQLEQVFANLVGNAIKYRRPDVPLEVAIMAERTDKVMEFAVKDNGIGIEAEYFDRIFEMFRRLHTHDKYDGTGIGLAIVKRILERHGGTVRVESVSGEGSTFFFTLPAA